MGKRILVAQWEEREVGIRIISANGGLGVSVKKKKVKEITGLHLGGILPRLEVMQDN